MSDSFTGNPIFRAIAKMFTWLYRLSRGRIGGQMVGLNVLLLTSIGRKSGKSRTMPLGFFEHEGSYVVTASNAGSDRHPDWFHNLKEHPNAEVQVGGTVVSAIARIADPDLRKKLWAKLIEISSHYAAYQKKTKRVIPMVLLEPER
ncbi:MAG: nitroreductase family deazaflavin-dependent oxidoreductase [Anaerolineales bacterium]